MARRMPAQLVSLNDGPNVLLDKPILLFGRDLECDVRFDSRKISRKHCCVAQVGEFLVVRDLGSTNGVRINGTRVLEGRLKQGDELTVGGHRYQVRVDGAAGGRSSAPANAKRAAPPPPVVASVDDEDTAGGFASAPPHLASGHGAEPVAPLPHAAEAPKPDTHPLPGEGGAGIIPDDIGLAPDLDSPEPEEPETQD